MIRIGTTSAAMAVGQRATAKTRTRCEDGYIVEFSPNKRGLAITDAELRIGKEILVQVTGFRGRMPIVHALFAGFR